MEWWNCSCNKISYRISSFLQDLQTGLNNSRREISCHVTICRNSNNSQSHFFGLAKFLSRWYFSEPLRRSWLRARCIYPFTSLPKWSRCFLLYRFHKKREMPEFTVFADPSFAPSGKHSQSGFTIHLSFRNVRHLIHWQSLREPKIAESSAESELYALASARRSARNMRLLIRESLPLL